MVVVSLASYYTVSHGYIMPQLVLNLDNWGVNKVVNGRHSCVPYIVMRNGFQKRLHAPKGRHLEPPICGGSQWRPPGGGSRKRLPEIDKTPASLSHLFSFKTKILLNEGRKYCRMLPLEHSAILLICIKR